MNFKQKPSVSSAEFVKLYPMTPSKLKAMLEDTGVTEEECLRLVSSILALKSHVNLVD